MSNLFYTGRRKRTSGAFRVEMKNGAKIAKRLQKLEKGGEVAIQRTVSDFSSRAPAWVSKGIRQHYGVDTKAIRDAGPTKKKGATHIKVAGKFVDGITIEYKGRTLTPIHFNMSPKTRQDKQNTKPLRIPGQAVSTNSPVAMVRPPKKYSVKATIIKGQRATMSSGTFVTAGNGGSVLPFQRTANAARMPIEVVRTLSVPQMIDGRANETIKELVGSNMEKRFNNQINRVIK